MDVNAPAQTSSPKCTPVDEGPDVIITAPPALPPVMIQPIPDLSPEAMLAPLPEDGGAKRKTCRQTQTQKQMSSSLSSLSSHRWFKLTEIDYQNVSLCLKCTCLLMPCMVFTEKGQHVQLCPCSAHQVTSVMFPFGATVFRYIPRTRTH